MKVAGSYPSLLRGVSQQPPEVRQPGQHTEQINMLSDPVAGLTRRPGSRLLRAEQIHGSAFSGAFTDEQAAIRLATSGSYRTIKHTADGIDYAVLVRGTANSTALASSLPPVVCYDITNKVFCPVSYVGGQAGDAGASLNAAGISAAASIGRYLVYAQNSRPCAMPYVPPWPGSQFTASVVWVRGGAYDRRFQVVFNGLITAYYDTPSPGVAGAATAISPQNIANQLASAIASLGYGTVTSGSHIYIAGTPQIVVSDGGDGSLIRGMTSDVESVDKLTLMGYHGQKVRVGYGSGTTGFYVQADVAGGGFGEAIWRETAGDVRSANMINNVGIMRIYGGICYVGMFDGSSPGGGLNAATLSTNPEFVPSGAGDETSNPTPTWMRGQITYMGVFQDRLLVGCGGSLSISAAGDYFNFFRSTVTTVPLKDPFEMTPQGGEDDILRHSVPYNKNIVIFGDKKQYLISGAQALTPTSANMSIMTVYADAAKCPPLAAGGQIYYARNRDSSVALHQIQPGTYVDSAESFPASAQIGTYIPAPAAELEAVPGAPAQMIVRSRLEPRSLYVFTYLDQPDGRKQDAWSKWTYHEKCGNLLGMTAVPDGLILMWARHGSDGKMYYVADLQPLNPELSSLPYLDSVRNVTLTKPYPVGLAATLQDLKIAQPDGWSCAFDATTDRFLIGGDLDENATLVASYPEAAATLQTGLEYDSYVIPTNPYQKDGQGKAILSGRTVITRLLLSLRRTAGMIASVIAGGVTTDYKFNGRILGNALNTIGTVPVADAQHTVSVGREGREYSVKLAAQKWYPFTIVGIEFTGQAFNRTPRA